MRRWLQAQLLQLTSVAPDGLTAGGRCSGGSGAAAAAAARELQEAWLGWRGFAAGRSLAAQPAPASAAGEEQRRSSGGGGGGEGNAADRAAELLRRFRDSLRPTPPVSFVRGMDPPTAMSWMRRRGPQVPHAVLYRLFRQRQVRLFDGSRVVRVRASRPLRNGELLLYPADLTPSSRGPAGAGPPQHPGLPLPLSQQQESRAGREAARQLLPDASWGGEGGRLASHAAAGPGPGSGSIGGGIGGSIGGRRSALFAPPEAEGDTAVGEVEASVLPAPPSVPLLTPERVRRWVLGIHPGLVFVNKPAGVRVHGRAAGDDDGGRGGRGGGGAGGGAARAALARSQTLEGAMQSALRFSDTDDPKLVHRLDEQASGVMVVARNADAAAWLSEAFRSKAAQAAEAEASEEEEQERGEGRLRGGSAAPRDGFSVRRTYWAFLAGQLQPRQSGRIRHVVQYPVLVDGAYQPAVSSYRVRAVGGGVSWVELTPETGRRHQLRIHCAHKLGAPIIGDVRYGYRGLPDDVAVRDLLPPEWWALLGTDPRVARRRAERAATPAPPPPPILLHARELVVKRPGKAAVVGVAPLPLYMRQLMEAAGWPVPREA
ncbi:hypothetical protein GPECTOR_192g309 [Gonium pectorale]|uniref:Pseudouridine synthase RsuA/RluA-like domain-containing protein n=1 Tax=Gonium pectorale TaxID=33097 RepID=A0A150FX26_GONPE|nr:hypothetical protein GPECTOR_192g309 [Gonium pectorale]|eukprot:KXZ42163.1 hypothetical protein GPECTOR_192g309 [Gonium pectorale]